MAKEVMMSMRMAPEAGAALSNHHAPPPAPAAADSYSSNYKGVMLCDRPGIEVSKNVGGGESSGGAIPFLSAVAAPEQLGLNPIKKQHLNASKGPTKPKNVVLSNHKRWLHSLQMLKRQLADEEEFLAEEEEMKKKRLAAESKKVRDQIRQIKHNMIAPADAEGDAGEQAAISKEGMLAELKGKFGKELVSEVLERTGATDAGVAPAYNDATQVRETNHNNEQQEVLEKTRARSAASSAKQKPAWARTEQEEEAAEDEEVEDLLDFAENLDIDKYMDDYEFQEALAAAKARITELDEGEEEGAEVGDDEDNQSMGSMGSRMTGASCMSQRLREKAAKEADKQQEWDGRTQCSDVSARSRVSTTSRAVAQEMLEMNPNLRKKHSTKSLAEVVDRMEFDPTDQNKFGRCGMGAVKVAIHNDEDRLHRMDVKEGKDLPYLYRNPAV